MTLKLYTVVRHDLSQGAQAAQSAHALAALALNHPYEFREWNNQTIVLLKSTDRLTIEKLVEAAEDGSFVYATFREPDHLLDDGSYYGTNVLTAISFAPNWLAQHFLLRDLPLAVSKTPKKKGWFSR
jgi:hypothetical protein